jgi:nucleotide-binding universal stress UspA family protein
MACAWEHGACLDRILRAGATDAPAGFRGRAFARDEARHDECSATRGMKRIVVGLDGSPRASGVLATATRIARGQGAKLTLIRSVGLPPDVPQDFWKTTDEPLLEVLRRHARESLDAQTADVPPELLAERLVVVGVPWQGICDTARRIAADLIVIGSHGYAGFDRLLGTTAAKVVNHAACSVLVVREPHGDLAVAGS